MPRGAPSTYTRYAFGPAACLRTASLRGPSWQTRRGGSKLPPYNQKPPERVGRGLAPAVPTRFAPCSPAGGQQVAAAYLRYLAAETGLSR